MSRMWHAQFFCKDLVGCRLHVWYNTKATHKGCGNSAWERWFKDNLSKATAHSKLAPLRYNTQSIFEYIAEWESCGAQLASRNTTIDKERLVTMFTKSFGDRIKSPYVEVINGLVTKEDLTWQPLTSQKLQKNIYLQSEKSPTKTRAKKAFIVRQKFGAQKRHTYR